MPEIAAAGDGAWTADSFYYHWLYSEQQYEARSRSPCTTDCWRRGVVNDQTGFTAFTTAMFGATAVPDLVKLYAPGTMAPGDAVAPPSDWWWSVSAMIGDYVLTCPARRAARQLEKLGHNVFVYYFSHQPTVSVNSYPTDEYGAFHGSEVQPRPKLCF